MDKVHARKRGLENRALLTKEQKFLYDNSLLSKMKALCIGKQVIGVFISLKQEPNTIPFIYWCFQKNKQVVVPKVSNDTLTFHCIHSLNECETGAYGIQEPISTIPVDLAMIDILFVPLSSFDKNKNRTGYGKGYYDRILKNVSYTVGLAYPEQEVDEIAVEETDVSLDAILLP